MFRKLNILLAVIMIAPLVAIAGCATSAEFNVGPVAAGVEGQVHEWKEPGFTFECDDENPPCKSSVTVGFVTGSSYITGGHDEPNSVKAVACITWPE